MKGFTDFVARLKAWQVFVVLIVPMVAVQFYLMSKITFPTSGRQPPEMEQVDALFRQSLLMSVIMLFLLLTWLVSIALAANRRVEPDLRLGTRLAIGCGLYAVAYAVLLQNLFPAAALYPEEGVSMALIIPLHLLAMLAIFYVLAFAARNIMMAERQSAVSFFDYSGPLFLMWFFPIGVWFVQPRVNRLVTDR